MLTLGDAITLCRTRANIGTGNISITEWVALINQAVRKIAANVSARDAGIFATRGTFTFPANTEHITITGGSYLNLTVAPEKIISVWEVESATTVSQSNTVISEVLPTAMGMEGFLHQGNPDASGIPANYYYTYHGAGQFGLLPVPDTAVNLIVNYIPAMPTLTTSDTATTLFGGKGTATMHDAVVDEVVMMLAQRGNTLNSATQIMYQQSQQALAQYGAQRESGPRAIHKRRRYF